MRLDLLLDSFYALSSLWGLSSGSPVCMPASSTGPVLRATYEVLQPAALRAPAAVTAFVDVHVVPMDTERVLANQTVIVEGTRIIALGPKDKITVPAGAKRIDGRGRYLIPGLSDMHTHPSGLEATFADMRTRRVLDLANGVTLIRYNGRVKPSVKQIWKDSMTAEVPSPRMYLAPDIPLETRPDSVAALVAAAKAAGYDHILIPHGSIQNHRATFDSMLAAARRMGLPISAHAHGLEDLDAALALGAHGGSLEHVKPFLDPLGFGKDRAQSPPSVSLPKIQAVAAATRRAGIWVSPTLRCIQGGSIPPTILAGLGQFVKALQDSGAGLLLGADDGFDVHDEMATFVRAGLTPYQALLTGTANAARYLGMLDSAGTVATGKRADLVLLYGNPLADIRHTREPAGVMIGGQWRDRAALDQLLFAVPKTWLMRTVNRRGIMVPIVRLREQLVESDPSAARRSIKESDLKDNVAAYRERLGVLTDSLEMVKPLARTGGSAYQHVLQRIAAELGAMRASLTSEQHEMLDPIVRVWLREQARQGHPVAVAGVVPGGLP